MTPFILWVCLCSVPFFILWAKRIRQSSIKFVFCVYFVWNERKQIIMDRQRKPVVQIVAGVQFSYARRLVQFQFPYGWCFFLFFGTLSECFICSFSLLDLWHRLSVRMWEKKAFLYNLFAFATTTVTGWAWTIRYTYHWIKCVHKKRPFRQLNITYHMPFIHLR